MGILDRYILGRFFAILIFASLASMVIFVTVDLIENLDRFIDAHCPAWLVFRYYFLYLPYILYLTLPVSMLLATLFTVGSLTHNHELAAMQSAGYSLYRVITLHLLVAVPAGAFAVGIGETIVPASNQLRQDIYRERVTRNSRPTAARQGRVYLQVGHGQFLHMESYDPAMQTGYQVTIQTVGANRILEQIEAQKIVWEGNAWRLVDGQTRIPRQEGEEIDKFDSLVRTDLGFKPSDLTKIQTRPEEMNYSELKAFVGNLRRSGNRTAKWAVDLAFKISQPFATVIIVFFGVPLAAIRRRGGLVLGFGLGLMVCFIYYGLMQTGKVLGYNETLSPQIAAWGGNFIFAVIGFFLMLWVRK
jgi:lipopolysaccharide export system permease protein